MSLTYSITFVHQLTEYTATTTDCCELDKIYNNAVKEGASIADITVSIPDQDDIDWKCCGELPN